jgi:hypothetical protein
MGANECAERARLILDWIDANPGLSRELAAKGIELELQRAWREGRVSWDIDSTMQTSR